ncbi:glycosyltransferase family 2 protein [Muribaculum intestinale]|uniref:Glycosyltransferase n=1 Tax=Muribaculum intestinale TaxID=1796646 RepID=A0A4S2G2R2_9BACT|nr:glycosyltransferase family 2 protein [Muribaculum intestinale]MYM11050.1 glycosyltransferase [Muribaculum intestinale]TGY76227.1 glycosyltransferase [Muribaculum intestinale]
MKISIITATWNSGATLRDTLESVLQQSYTNYEILIIDGGSSDNTHDIVEEYIPKFDGRLHWHTGKDKGLYDAMNKGIARATGDIIGILNSDDFYADSDVLSRIAEGCRNVEAVYGNLDFVDASDTSKVVRQWRGSQHRPGAFLKGWHPAHPTFYARRKCYERLGGFDISFDVSADFELMLRFLEANRLSNRYIPHTFVKMRMGGESTGSIGKIIQGNRNVLRAFRKNGFKVPPFYLLRRLAPKALNLIKNKMHI